MEFEVGEYTVKIGKPLLEDEWPGCVEETWVKTKDGKRDRPDGLPHRIYRDLATGKEVYKEYWIPNGDELNPTTRIEIRTDKLHYDELSMPGQAPGRVGVGIDPRTGAVIKERYEDEDQRLHREGGLPADWQKDPDTGVVFDEWYFERGEQHRLSGPAEIRRDRETGKTLEAHWYQHGAYIDPPDNIPDLSGGPR